MAKAYLQYLRKQSFWLFILLSLMSVHVHVASPFRHFSYLPEVSRILDNSLSSNDLNTAYDLDDCVDLLLTASPEISRANESCLPLQCSQTSFQISVSEISLAHLSRPPPFSFPS